MPLKSDLEIAHQANMMPIVEIAKKIGISNENLVPYGHFKAKVDLTFINQQQSPKVGKLILVTAITPTAKGEGKTTTTVGLGDGLNRIGKKTIICLREPALGPCFGVKGGAAGGGYSQIMPMEDINLHFTGDFHAITSAHNLLSALIDNHIYWGNELGIDPRKITWRRVMDMNDRALREIVISLGKGDNGCPREDGFDITVASEIMAILCLSNSKEELKNRLDEIVIGKNFNNQFVKAKDLKATGAMMVLLKDAMMPNLVQTLENNPVFVHGGPFANISLGCNSVMATGLGLKLSDYVVTEAGFGADLGAEKFFDIKCRKAGFSPSVVVLVVTVRALKSHGELQQKNTSELEIGLSNLACHIENIEKFGVPITVAINYFSEDTEAEIQTIIDFCNKLNIKAFKCTNWLDGGSGIEDLSRHVAHLADQNNQQFKPLYGNQSSLWNKIKTIATEIYRAKDIEASKVVEDKLKRFEESGYGHFPICMAKTQYSFSTDPALKGAPTNHIVHIKDVYLCAGAEFIVVICGNMMTMPGLPRIPNAEHMQIINDKIEGLF